VCEEMFPLADYELIEWICDARQFNEELDPVTALLRLRTVNKKQPIKFEPREKGGLIPDPRISGIMTVSRVMDEAKKIWGDIDLDKQMTDRIKAWEERTNNGISLDQLVQKFEAGNKDSDKLCQTIWPPRGKGDLAIRRSRFYDLYKCWGRDSITLAWSMRGQDYIRTLITVWYAMSAGKDWTNNCSWMFQLTIEQWDKTTSHINNRLKSNQSQEGWHMYAELKCLTGYRLIPWPGYDEEKDTEALAKGGLEKDLPKGGFAYWVKVALKSGLALEHKYETFLDFLKSGEWITQGASSIGRLEVTYEGKTYNVKCRKNLVPDAFTPEMLHAMSMEHEGQRSTAFIKEELGKCRVAVCSDLETYLKMCYIVHMSGRGYKYWKSVTRQENVRTKIYRMLRTIRQCQQNLFGMAWDYEGFDRQVKTIELMLIYIQIASAASYNIPMTSRSEWDLIRANVDASFNKSVIISMSGKEYPVEGGLPSGLYLTSICGDGFNKTFCVAVNEILQMLGIQKVPDDQIDIQGDDTNVMNDNVAVLQLFDWLLQRCGVRGGNGKFGITQAGTEFLRVSFNNSGAHGYPARAIAGIVQRKPWSDTPAKETDIIEAILESINTCTRRGLKFGDSADRMIRIWCKKNRIPYIAARVPRENGGLGLGVPIANIRVIGIPKFNTGIGVHVQRRTTFREQEWISRGAKLGIQVPENIATEISDIECSRTVVGDQIRGVTKAIRKKWKTDIAESTIRQFKKQDLGVVIDHVALANGVRLMGEGECYERHKTYGNYERELEELVTVKTLATHNVVNVMNWTKTNRPSYYRDLITLGSRIGIKDSENWLLGKMSANVGSYNPIVTSQVAALTSRLINIGSVPKGRLIDIWTKVNRYVLEAMNKSPKIQELYRW